MDTSWTTEPDFFNNLIHSVFGSLIDYQIDIVFREIARSARMAGNDDAARNLEHFILARGDVDDYPVEKMLRELPLWRQDIVEDILTPSATGALANPPQSEIHGCKIYTYNTTGGLNPLTNEYDTWRRVGQGSSHRTVDEMIFSRGFDLGGADGNAFISPNLSGATREEFDWFIAMNAFDYSLGIAIVEFPATGEAEICYRIDIADEYAWYSDVSNLDAVMGFVDFLNLGEHYAIRGSSEVRCQRFNTSNINFSDPINVPTVG